MKMGANLYISITMDEDIFGNNGYSEQGLFALEKQSVDKLCKLAEMGKSYASQLEDQVVRLCLTLELGAEEPVLRGIVKTAGAEDLMLLKAALEKRLAESLPTVTQLGSFAAADSVESGFLI